MPYVYAGCETLFHLVEDNFDKYFDGKEKFLLPYSQNITNKYLITYGTGLNRKNNTKLRTLGKYTKGIIKTLFSKSFMNFPKFLIEKNLLELFIDSGGFQATMGFLSDDELPLFIKEYRYFIENYHHLFTRAFTLDLLLLEGKYSTEKEMLYINQKSFEELTKIDESIRKNKLLFIYHFRTKKLYRVWKQISKDFENEFSDYYSAGGIVATSNDNSSPILSYTVPIVYTILAAKKRNLKNVRLHFLGGSAFTDVFTYKIFKKVVKKYHDINLDISFDSSAAFKQVEIARFMNIIKMVDNLPIILDVDLRESNISNYQHKKYGFYKTALDMLDDSIWDFLKKMKKPEYFTFYKKFPVYKDGKFIREKVFFYKMYIGYLYKMIEEVSQKFADSLDLDFDDNLFKFASFHDQVAEIMTRINKGKHSRQLKKKLNLSKTIETIKNLDLDYIDYIVENYYEE